MRRFEVRSSHIYTVVRETRRYCTWMIYCVRNGQTKSIKNFNKKMDRLIGSLRALDENCSADRIQQSSATFRGLKGIGRKEMVKAWLREMTADPGKELAYLYVANDVIQKSMAREGSEFANEFGNVLAYAFEIAVSRNKTIISKVERLVKIWGDRNIYVKQMLKSFLKCIQGDGGKSVNKKRKTNSSLSSPRKKKTKVVKSKRSKQEKERGYFGNIVPKVRDDTLKALLQQLSQAKNGIQKGVEKFNNVEDIVREGGIPVEFVDNLAKMEKSEFDEFKSQVTKARTLCVRRRIVSRETTLANHKQVTRRNVSVPILRDLKTLES